MADPMSICHGRKFGKADLDRSVFAFLPELRLLLGQNGAPGFVVKATVLFQLTLLKHQEKNIRPVNEGAGAIVAVAAAVRKQVIFLAGGIKRSSFVLPVRGINCF